MGIQREKERARMRQYITDFMNEYELGPRERVAIAIAYERINEAAEARDRVQRILSGYDKNTDYITPELISEVELIAKAAGVHLYTAELVTCIALTRMLRVRLAQLGVSKKSISLTVADFTYKIKECEEMYGIVGIDVWSWYTKFFSLRIVAFGRLQFEVREYSGGTYKKGEKVLKNGDTALSVHIPRNGEPLDEKLCNRAYKEAKAFFCKLLGVEDIAFMCISWLLYEKNREFLPPTSNIVKFMNRYDIVETIPSADIASAPIKFIFLRKNDTPISELPRGSSLQRAYAELMENGGLPGCGKGVFFLQEPQKA